MLQLTNFLFFVETTPNYNGEGKIDIRIRQGDGINKPTEDDRLIFSD